MSASLALAAVLMVAPVAGLPTAVWQLAPEVKLPADGDPAEIQATKTRAVLLIHGLQLHPLRPDRAAKPAPHEWQSAKSELVKALAADADVFGFGYAQTVPVDAVSLTPGLVTAIEKLKAAEYREIVLIGHSAGGLIARQFVERHPNAGVTKVVQIASPNAGSTLANVLPGVMRGQAPFVRSLAPRSRTDIPALPAEVDFCSVVCKVRGLSGDTLVTLDSQWPAELRSQGVPAALVAVSHFDAMKAPQSIGVIAELAREKLVRWTPEQIETARQIVFGKDADAAAAKKPGGRNGLLARFGASK